MTLQKCFLKKTTEYGIKNADFVVDLKAAENFAKNAHMIVIYTK
jgi:hypothetical protein